VTLSVANLIIGTGGNSAAVQPKCAERKILDSHEHFAARGQASNLRGGIAVVRCAYVSAAILNTRGSFTE